MKIVSLVCAFLILFIGNALAVSSISVETINEAQTYGKTKVKEPLSEFLIPWVSYEEKAVTLNDTAEHAYLYTPFLLMATDAREKSLKGQNVSIADSERVLADYTDLLSFSLVLFGDKQDFAQNATVALKQGTNEIGAYQVSITSNSENLSKDLTQPSFKAQCYFYFLEKSIKMDMPIVLYVTTIDKKQHSFYFDMAKIQ